MGFLNNLINGISLGSIYAVIALGYTLVYGIAKMLNFAHGDVIMVGGYVIFTCMTTWGLNSWLSIVLAKRWRISRSDKLLRLRCLSLL